MLCWGEIRTRTQTQMTKWHNYLIIGITQMQRKDNRLIPEQDLGSTNVFGCWIMRICRRFQGKSWNRRTF